MCFRCLCYEACTNCIPQCFSDMHAHGSPRGTQMSSSAHREYSPRKSKQGNHIIPRIAFRNRTMRRWLRKPRQYSDCIVRRQWPFPRPAPPTRRKHNETTIRYRLKCNYFLVFPSSRWSFFYDIGINVCPYAYGLRLHTYISIQAYALTHVHLRT